MEIGVINRMINGGDCFAHVSEFGLKVCQLLCWEPHLATEKVAKVVREKSAESGVRVCAVWAYLPGPQQWNSSKVR